VQPLPSSPCQGRGLLPKASLSELPPDKGGLGGVNSLGKSIIDSFQDSFSGKEYRNNSIRIEPFVKPRTGLTKPMLRQREARRQGGCGPDANTPVNSCVAFTLAA
jgi:hypothetical protein